jgi:hypothetical protein
MKVRETAWQVFAPAAIEHRVGDTGPSQLVTRRQRVVARSRRRFSAGCRRRRACRDRHCWSDLPSADEGSGWSFRLIHGGGSHLSRDRAHAQEHAEGPPGTRRCRSPPELPAPSPLPATIVASPVPAPPQSRPARSTNCTAPTRGVGRNRSGSGDSRSGASGSNQRSAIPAPRSRAIVDRIAYPAGRAFNGERGVRVGSATIMAGDCQPLFRV